MSTTSDVTQGLTALIASTLGAQRQEEAYPSSTPDAMDDHIAHCKKRVKLLRELREQFENEMASEL